MKKSGNPLFGAALKDFLFLWNANSTSLWEEPLNFAKPEN